MDLKGKDEKLQMGSCTFRVQPIIKSKLETLYKIIAWVYLSIFDQLCRASTSIMNYIDAHLSAKSEVDRA